VRREVAPARQLVDGRIKTERAGRDGVVVVASEPSGPALVLGSTQPDTDADARRCAALGVAIARRRSGGGAVYVAPGAQVWIDVFLPARHRLFEVDVGRSFRWLGEAWAGALRRLPDCPWPGEISVAPPGAPRGQFAATLCFASVGAGEVLWAGRKVVGLSQRRDRQGAWIHSMAPVVDHSGLLLDCLRLEPARRAAATAELGRVAGWVPVSPGILLEAVTAEIARAVTAG
jgi:lipoate-protein ligase A